MRARLLAVALLSTWSSLAVADDAVAVSSAWARASTPHATSGAVYLSITGKAADRLLGASTPVAAEASLHQSRMVGGVMQMRPVETLPVAPGQTVVLAPGGYHLMLTGLKQTLLAGEHFPLILRFEKSGEVTATVTVQKLGAAAPANDMADGMPGMGMGGK